MKTTVPVVYPAINAIEKAFGLPPTTWDNTTLNEKLNILSDVTAPEGSESIIQYVGIGIGGASYSIDSDGILETAPKQRSARMSGPFREIPYVLRHVDDDLTPDLRNNYRFRKVEEHNGVSMIAYYLKKFNVDALETFLEVREVADGKVTARPYTPTYGDLHPTAPTGTNLVGTRELIVGGVRVPFVLTEFDIAELLDVSTVLFGTPNKAIISEVFLCRGVDMTVPGSTSGLGSDYVEAVNVMLHSSTATSLQLGYGNTAGQFSLEVMSASPLSYSNANA